MSTSGTLFPGSGRKRNFTPADAYSNLGISFPIQIRHRATAGRRGDAFILLGGGPLCRQARASVCNIDIIINFS
jgi:hypothetical protein